MKYSTVTKNPEITRLTEDIYNQKFMYGMFLNHRREDVLRFMFSEGYFLPMHIKKRDEYSNSVKPYMERRKESLTKRYKIWKNLRAYFRQKYAKAVTNIMYPGKKRMILDVSNCPDTKKAIQTIYDMMVNYIPIYDVYMYNPVPGSGYKYYTGENIIMYHIGTDMDKQERTRIAKAARQEDINGYKNQWRILITTVKYNGLKGWYRTEISNLRNIEEWVMLSWKCLDDPALFRKYYNLLGYAKRNGIQPWPYRFKKDSTVKNENS